MKSAVLFDFDGTLAFMQPSHRELYEQAINECNKSTQSFSVNEFNVQDAWEKWRTDKGIEHLQYSRSKEDYHELRKTIHANRLKKLNIQNNVEMISERIIELESNTNFYILYDDVIESLNMLSQYNIELGIVSNHLWNLKDITQYLGINKYFKCIISSAQIGYRKPHPEIYESALSQINSLSNDVLFIGDNLESDYFGPIKAGLSAILLDRNRTNEMHDSINSLNELSALL